VIVPLEHFFTQVVTGQQFCLTAAGIAPPELPAAIAEMRTFSASAIYN
jgi:hypothetical protein